MHRQAPLGAAALNSRFAGAIILAAAIFVVDTFTTLMSAVAVLYVLVLILLGDVAPKRAIWASVVVCMALTLFSFFYVHGVHGHVDATLRLVFSLAALIATAFIVLRRHADQETLAAQADLLDVTRDAIFLTDSRGRIVYWNHGAEQLYGWTCEEAYGEDAHALLSTYFPVSRGAIRQALAETGSWQGELIHRTRDGRAVQVLSRWRWRESGRRHAGTILETDTDITDQKAAAEALEQSERRFRTIFQTLAVAIWEHDLRPLRAWLNALRAEGITDLGQHLGQNPGIVREMRATVPVTDVNDTALRLMGIATKEDFFGQLNDYLVDSDDDFIAFLLALDSGQPSFVNESTVRTRQGTLLRVIAAFNFPPPDLFDRVQVCILDVTERIRDQEALQRTRDQLEHALRAATVGEVSASIAHEINQPLAAITTQAAAARRWLDRTPPDLDEVRACLDEAASAARRASQVVRRIRSFMTQVEPERVPLDINAIIDEALRLIQNDLASNGVSLLPSPSLPGAVIEGDRIMLQQLLINLMTNALQAMQTLPEGVRRLTVHPRHVDGGIAIDVFDSGPGFSEQAAQKAFEPFFTTKSNGMGLGLAMCRTIVSAHEGRITIEPPGAGWGGRITAWVPVAASVSAEAIATARQ